MSGEICTNGIYTRKQLYEGEVTKIYTGLAGGVARTTGTWEGKTRRVYDIVKNKIFFTAQWLLISGGPGRVCGEVVEWVR